MGKLTLEGSTESLQTITFAKLANWYQDQDDMLTKARAYQLHWAAQVVDLEHYVAAGKTELKKRIQRL